MNPDVPFHDNEWSASVRDPALAVTHSCPAGDTRDHLAREAYSYRLVYEAFAPLLRRWGEVREVTQPESRLDFALRRFRQQGRTPLHLSFMPLHQTYLTADAPNVAFPFWEFADIPNRDFADDPRNNWRRIAEALTYLFTACTFTRDAIQSAGVRTPVAVVPVPIREAYFQVPGWSPGQRVTLDCPAYVLPQRVQGPPVAVVPWEAFPGMPRTPKQYLRFWYGEYVRPLLPRNLVRELSLFMHPERRPTPGARKELPYLASPQLELSGVVYAAILNPFDQRKNLLGLLTAFLDALGDRPDATLVLKLALGRGLVGQGLQGVFNCYRALGIPHRCKVAVIGDYLSDEQMAELARASTYHVNASRAEGANLPLQDYLAAGRPGVSPDHTAMRDYFHDEMGFVVSSSPEPARFPHAPDEPAMTRWHVPHWDSLRDQLRASYEVARSRPRQYGTLARRAREQIEDHARAERVWPRLAAALNAAAALGYDKPRREAGVPCFRGPSQLLAIRQNA